MDNKVKCYSPFCLKKNGQGVYSFIFFFVSPSRGNSSKAPFLSSALRFQYLFPSFKVRLIDQSWEVKDVTSNLQIAPYTTAMFWGLVVAPTTTLGILGQQEAFPSESCYDRTRNFSQFVQLDSCT